MAELDHRTRRRALLILIFMPLFFSSNIIFGRAAINLGAEPFTLAFLRWGLSAAILMPFVIRELRQADIDWTTFTGPLLLMGFLGMWVCGALVYFALKYTSATNGTLIYTSSPVLILLIEWAFRGRRIGLREAIGIMLAFFGVVAIVVRGDFDRLIGLSFNLGDLIFVATAISWAIYSVLLRTERFQAVPTFPLFALIAAAGALTLAPFAVFEIAWTLKFPNQLAVWGYVAGIVFLSSIIAFSSFQYGVKVVGSSVAGIFLYLLPVYGVAMAVLFLGETLEAFHFWGIALVLGGVVLATWPKRNKGQPKL